MARNRDKQFIGNHVGFNMMEDCGIVTFTTTGTTVTISTHLRAIKWAEFTPVTLTDHVVERFYIGDPAHGGFHYTNVGDLTITRVCDPLLFSGVASADYITANDYVEVQIGICPVAGTLMEAWYYNDVKNGGTPLINLGHVPTNGAGTADPDEFLADAKAEAAPASSVGKAFNDFTATAVGADDLLTFSTTGGTDSDPQGGFCQMKIRPTPTSGLVLMYRLIGK